MALQRATDSRYRRGRLYPRRCRRRRCCDAFQDVNLDEIASGADLGGSSNYSTANLKTEVGKVSM